MPLNNETVAVVGATGAVGVEALALLEGEGVAPENVRLFASSKRAGETVRYAGVEVALLELSEAQLAGVTVSILAAAADIAREWAPRFVEAGAVVVDNSSAFRMTPGIGLIVPEVNGSLVAGDRTPRILANPNCSTIILLVAAHPLRARFGCRRLDVSTYQAVSGAGAAAIEELESQTRAVLAGEAPAPSVFAEPCAFNVFSHDSPVNAETGMNVEEQKMIDEVRKIWDDTDVLINPMCVRVPVRRAHCESVTITLGRPAAENQVREALGGAPGIALLDDRGANRFPTTLRASNSHDVLVGRLRPDHTRPGSAPGTYGAYTMFIAGDQLLKGAALNAVQIARLAVGG
jgi:aspartate-semialdehyde dehydrogenase